MELSEAYRITRNRSVSICKPLHTEDYVVQPIADVSPPKWHLGHTTWFFETMILKPYMKGYKEFNADYNYVFNSYYETAGARVIRTDRGNLSRPTVEEIYQYRDYVDKNMLEFLSSEKGIPKDVVTIGLNHEQQHQELLITDIKYILGHNPLFPKYGGMFSKAIDQNNTNAWTKMEKGLYEIGYKGNGFCFDNELNAHAVYLQGFEICNRLVTNGEYLEFIEDGGYSNFNYWHAEAWDWIKTQKITAPLYWHQIEYNWHEYTLSGLHPLDKESPVNHVSYYEAFAYAQWKGLRLPTEFEWEAASKEFDWGRRWEWTESAYLPYPGFSRAAGALGEYNGKFMVSQKVLRGASEATSPGHSRNTYRNFFYPNQRWQFTGIRLAK